MSQTAVATLVAAFIASGGVVTICPTRFAFGALRAAIKHMPS